MKRPIVLALVVFLVCGSAALSNAQQKKAPRKKPQRPNPAFATVKDDSALPRVLLIGDSISIGYTVPVRQLLAGKANVHRPHTNCGPTIRGLEQRDQWLGDGHWDVIHFNWGLHDLRRDDGKNPQVAPEQYAKNLDELVKRLKKTGATLIWCSTTPVPEGTGNRIVGDSAKYNALAQKVIDAHGIETDNLFSFALPRLKEIQRPANVHFTAEGSKILAKQVAGSIEKALKTRQQ